jgi:DNA-binding transcriptional LysR family regulator
VQNYKAIDNIERLYYKFEMNWENFRYFLALARHKTLASAGKSLLVSNVTVYRRIKAFEEQLGVILFEHNPSGYILTSAAEQLLEEIEPVEDILETSLREFQGLDQRIHGSIVIATTDTLGSKILPSILKKFKSTFPELSIELKVGQETVSLSKREADIAVRTSKQPPPNLVGRKVGNINFAVYGASSYLEKYDSISFPDDVSNHHFLVLDDSLSHLKIKQWMDKKITNEADVTKVNGMLPLFELCEAGVGLAALPTFLTTQKHTNLKEIYPIPDPSGIYAWVLTHRDLTRSTRVRVTTEFLYHELRPYFS